MGMTSFAGLQVGLTAMVSCMASLLLAHLAGAGPSRPWHKALPPFGQLDVVGVQSLAVLPLLLWAARWLIHRSVLSPTVWRLLAMAVWIGVAYATLTFGSRERQTGEFSVGLAAGERLACVILWQAPICLAGLSYRSTTGSSPAEAHGPGGGNSRDAFRKGRAESASRRREVAGQLVTGLLLATLIPSLYVVETQRRLGERVSRLVARQQLWEAWQLAGRWQEMGALSGYLSATQPILPRQLHRELTEELAQIAARAEAELPPHADLELIYRRAADLAALGRTTAALDLIEPQLAVDRASLGVLPAPAEVAPRPSTPVALAEPGVVGWHVRLVRLRAELSARQGAWREAAQWCERALQLTSRDDAAWLELTETVADFWRRAGDYRRAEQGLLAAQQAAESASAPLRARCEMMLADHYREGGRPVAAAQGYQRALAWAAESASWEDRPSTSPPTLDAGSVSPTDVTEENTSDSATVFMLPESSEAATAAARETQELVSRAQRSLRELERSTPWCLWPRGSAATR